MQKLVMVMRADRPEHTPESEGLTIDTDTPGIVRLVLDDGVEITCDAAVAEEISAALHVEAA